MSVDVLHEVFTRSQSRGVARNVLTVLADAAHPDGVTWLPISPAKNGDPTKCLTHRANASKRAIIDAVQELVALGEVQVRKAQRGRAKINVYRVVLGTVGWMDVDYADLPFELEQPFGRLGAECAPSQDERPGADSVATGCSSRDDWVQFSSSGKGPQSGMPSVVEVTFSAPQPSREPSLEPEAKTEPPEQTRAHVAALVATSLSSGLPVRDGVVDVDPLLELLPAHEIKPNTRGVLERKFSQLPPRFVGLAVEELLERERDPLAADVRSRVRYVNGIADRMIAERERAA